MRNGIVHPLWLRMEQIGMYRWTKYRKLSRHLMLLCWNWMWIKYLYCWQTQNYVVQCCVQTMERNRTHAVLNTLSWKTLGAHMLRLDVDQIPALPTTSKLYWPGLCTNDGEKSNSHSLKCLKLKRHLVLICWYWMWTKCMYCWQLQNYIDQGCVHTVERNRTHTVLNTLSWKDTWCSYVDIGCRSNTCTADNLKTILTRAVYTRWREGELTQS